MAASAGYRIHGKEVRWPFPFGAKGQPWGDDEIKNWANSITPQRCYKQEVLDRLEKLRSNEQFMAHFEIVQYGALSLNPARYPLLCVRSKQWEAGKKNVLITGGVHGYETSGVQGALLFLRRIEDDISKGDVAVLGPTDGLLARINFLVAPCVSPWGYECIQRWTSRAVDPNRSFNRAGFHKLAAEEGGESPEKVRKLGDAGPPGGATTEESIALMRFVYGLAPASGWTMHIDLHETTDSDVTEFRPAKVARDGGEFDFAKDGDVPDGYYLVSNEAIKSDAARWQHYRAFNKAILAAVSQVTHICENGEKAHPGEILEFPVEDGGVIYIPVHSLHLCASLTDAVFACTTEVYPDSPGGHVTDDLCNEAQAVTINAGLKYILGNDTESRV